MFKLLHVIKSGDLECLTSAREYLCAIATLTLNKDLNVAAPGLNALSKLAMKSPEGCQMVFLGPVGEIFKNFWSDVSEVTHIRIYNV
jgi:hypothetical protein